MRLTQATFERRFDAAIALMEPKVTVAKSGRVAQRHHQNLSDAAGLLSGVGGKA